MSFFTVEFVIRAHYAGFDIAEIPVPSAGRASRPLADDKAATIKQSALQ
jgi:hypothetical protein